MKALLLMLEGGCRRSQEAAAKFPSTAGWDGPGDRGSVDLRCSVQHHTQGRPPCRRGSGAAPRLPGGSRSGPGCSWGCGVGGARPQKASRRRERFPWECRGGTVGDHVEPFTLARRRVDTSPSAWGIHAYVWGTGTPILLPLLRASPRSWRSKNSGITSMALSCQAGVIGAAPEVLWARMRRGRSRPRGMVAPPARLWVQT